MSSLGLKDNKGQKTTGLLAVPSHVQIFSYMLYKA